MNYTSPVQVAYSQVRSRDNGDLQPRPPSVRVSARLIAFRDRLETAPINRGLLSLILLSLILIYFLLTAPCAHRLLWHDELFTYYIANAPTMARFWQELRLDLNPPLEYLAVRASLHFFGQSEYATRLPSILAFLMGSLCFYRFIAGRLKPVYGMLAMILLWASPFFYYATEARPYALVMGFFGLSLLAWDRASRPERTIVSVVLLLLAITGMMLSHLFALLYIVPFGLAELWLIVRRRRIDVLVWVALLVPCCIPFIYLSKVRGYGASAFPPAFQASVFQVVAFYYGSLRREGPALLIALCCGLAAAWRGNGVLLKRTRKISLVDLVLIIAILAMPVIVNVVQMRSHAAFFARYAAIEAFGFSWLLACFLAMYTEASRSAAVVFAGCMLAYTAALNLGPDAKPSFWAKRGAPSAEQQSRALEAIDPNLPLVAASGLTFLEMDHYAEPEIVSRLYYLTDRTLAIQYAHATIFEGFPILKSYFPIRAAVEPYSQFVQEHRQFLVLGTANYPEDWLIPVLVHSGASLRQLGNFPGPYKDSELYLVSMPRS